MTDYQTSKGTKIAYQFFNQKQSENSQNYMFKLEVS